ncbi:MAG: hypothetical protein ACD_20C00057G0010 [uncultured bacterium]|nr:MAG: hypothetical protein ACD_20C00057G0010 [uncultured bacterium]HBH19172.1 hypothetical protein [Cyanobacteria bacterium UBA9579]
MFIDKSKIKVMSGSGGNGVVAWRKEKYVPKGGPAGGDGGLGGSIYIEADENMSTLLDFKYKSRFIADNGEPGRGKNQHGKNGNDVYIKVPTGTIIRDVHSNKIIGDLILHGDKILVASGGRGGRGNSRFTTSIRRAPQFCEPGEPGIERDLELELKLIADVGLLGLPNAGKSTLISVISAAKPKIADYPFTTLTPNLGVVKKPSGDGFVVADIPGLIEGASLGAGLGQEFLRHVERTRLLVHVLDITEEDPVKNYDTINQELKSYGGKLIETPQVIALNKIDAADPDKVSQIEEYFKKEKKDVFVISAATKQGVQDLVNYLTEKVNEIPPPTLEIEIEEDHIAYDHDDSGFMVYKEKKTFTVAGGRIERLLSVTDTKNIESIWRLQNIMTSMGIFKALEEAGIQDGDTVRIANYEFEYYADKIREVHDEG